jgi:hypothetical protein
MSIEDQVCSLELSKRLKDLGVKQESIFFWRDNDGFEEITECNFSLVQYINPSTTTWYASAFTVKELGVMLPIKIKNKYIHMHKDHMGFSITYKDCNNQIHYFGKFNKSETNVRAEMLIYLLEEGLIKND